MATVSFFKNIYYFCHMNEVDIRVFTRSEELPAMTCRSFFHSADFFRIAEVTSGHTPFMVVAEQDGRVVAHLLALLRRRGSFLPPYLYSQGRIYGEGEYDNGVDKELIFSLFLQTITRIFRRRLCLYTEFSDISSKMFGYRYFRENGYFPVPWQEVHNSLHSVPPEERLTEKSRSFIEQASIDGIESVEANSEQGIHEFYQLLRRFFRLKIRRFIPSEKHFKELYLSGKAHILLIRFHGRVLGGCCYVVSGCNAYLWYLASRRKRYRHLHPDTLSVWAALKHAYQQQLEHVFFMDAGLPYKNNRFRSFILSFGGKPVAKYRWFRSSIAWVNRLLSWIYS